MFAFSSNEVDRPEKQPTDPQAATAARVLIMAGVSAGRLSLAFRDISELQAPIVKKYAATVLELDLSNNNFGYGTQLIDKWPNSRSVTSLPYENLSKSKLWC